MIRPYKLQKKPKYHSGIRDEETRREFPRHRRFVRSHQCVVPGCEDGPIECMHVRHANTAGTGLKPPDWETVSGCRAHHSEQHQIGTKSFEAKYGIDLDRLAAEFARRSPDLEMKAAMRANTGGAA